MQKLFWEAKFCSPVMFQDKELEDKNGSAKCRSKEIASLFYFVSYFITKYSEHKTESHINNQFQSFTVELWTMINATNILSWKP